MICFKADIGIVEIYYFWSNVFDGIVNKLNKKSLII